MSEAPLKLSDIAKKQLPKKAVESFTQFVTERTYSALIHANPRPRTPGLHVSSIIPNCLRMPSYGMILGKPMDLRGIYRTGIGTALHEHIKILEVQEMALEWEGIRTDGIDEYSPELGIFADKKFTWGPPDFNIWPNHNRQLEYYKNIMVKNDVYATHGFIIYFDLSNPRVFVRYANKIRKINVLAKEMLKKRDILHNVRKTAILPDRKIGGECNFCPFAMQCLREVL